MWLDFEDFETKAADPATTLTILCSPHNPVGRVWNSEELTRLGEICLQNDVLIIADEIHGDLILPGKRFTPFGTLAEELVNNSDIDLLPGQEADFAGFEPVTFFTEEGAGVLVVAKSEGPNAPGRAQGGWRPQP